MEADKVPPPKEDQEPVPFYRCVFEQDPATGELVPDKTVACIKSDPLRELIFRVEVYQDFVEKVRRQCVK